MKKFYWTIKEIRYTTGKDHTVYTLQVPTLDHAKRALQMLENLIADAAPQKEKRKGK